MWSSFVAILLKEFKHIFRDRGTLIIFFTMPIMQLALFGFLDQNVRDLPTVVVDQDQIARVARADGRDARDQDVRRSSSVTNSPERARAEIAQGTVRVGVIIPPDYHERRARHDNAQFLVLIDGSDSTVSAQALAAINGLVAQANLDAVARRGRATRGLGAADRAVQSRGPDRELHHPRPDRDPAAARGADPRVDRDRARARARHDGAAARHADQSGRARARQARAVPRDRPGRDGADPRDHAVRASACRSTAACCSCSSPRSSTCSRCSRSASRSRWARRPRCRRCRSAQMLLLPSIFLSGYIFPVAGAAARPLLDRPRCCRRPT